MTAVRNTVRSRSDPVGDASTAALTGSGPHSGTGFGAAGGAIRRRPDPVARLISCVRRGARHRCKWIKRVRTRRRLLLSSFPTPDAR